MAEEFLNLAEIGAASQQMGGEAVAKCMGANVRIRADASDIALYQQPNRFAAKSFAAA